MSTEPELPPAADETGTNEVPPSTTSPPAGGSGMHGPLPGGQQVDPSQFTHESKLPPLRLEDAKRRLATGPTLIAIGGLVSVLALASVLAFAPSPPPQKAPEAQSEQAAVAPGIQRLATDEFSWPPVTKPAGLHSFTTRPSSRTSSRINRRRPGPMPVSTINRVPFIAARLGRLPATARRFKPRTP